MKLNKFLMEDACHRRDSALLIAIICREFNLSIPDYVDIICSTTRPFEGGVAAQLWSVSGVVYEWWSLGGFAKQKVNIKSTKPIFKIITPATKDNTYGGFC